MIFPTGGLHKFDASIDFESACLAEPASVAYYGVSRINVTPSDRVIIFGAGTIGLLTLQAAKTFGAKQVVLVDRNEFRLQKAIELGADSVIDLTIESLSESCDLLTDGGGFDVVIEASGSPAAMENMLLATKAGSRICLMGLCGGHPVKMDTDRIVITEIHLCGSLGSPGVWATVLDLMKSGKIITKPLITHRFALNELDQAFKTLLTKEPMLIKAVLKLE